MSPVLHLIPNAHRDPVWLRDCAEGMAEAISTVSAMVMRRPTSSHPPKNSGSLSRFK